VKEVAMRKMLWVLLVTGCGGSREPFDYIEDGASAAEVAGTPSVESCFAEATGGSTQTGGAPATGGQSSSATVQTGGAVQVSQVAATGGALATGGTSTITTGGTVATAGRPAVTAAVGYKSFALYTNSTTSEPTRIRITRDDGTSYTANIFRATSSSVWMCPPAVEGGGQYVVKCDPGLECVGIGSGQWAYCAPSGMTSCEYGYDAGETVKTCRRS
jgi:hypothetical protein